MTQTNDDRQIALGYTIKSWRKLTLDENDPGTADWKTAVDIFRKRIFGRFVEPVDKLIELDANEKRGTIGFSVLAIDFLVIETLQGFREGVTNHDKKSQKLFVSFLSNWAPFTKNLAPNDIQDKAKELYRSGRCALHHSGSTDNLWVNRSGPMIDFSGGSEIKVNRTSFHKELVAELERYCTALVDPKEVKLRANFISKMKHIVGP